MAKKKSAFDRLPPRPAGAGNAAQRNAQALTLLQQGQWQAGTVLLRESLALNPKQPEIAYNLGFALQQQGLLDAAITAYGQAIALVPGDAEALMARGAVLASRQRFNDAAADFAKATQLAPHNADAWNNYGNALLELPETNSATTALAAYDKALTLRPNFAQALFNKGKALGELARYAEAAAAYEAALAQNPNYAEARWHLAWLYLLQGDFARGWPLFEARWEATALGNTRRYPQLPQWLGEGDLAGKSLLLYAEQGLGDTLQFCRYVPMLQALGATVSLAVQAPLVPLLAGQWPGVTVAEAFTDTSGFDWATPLMSLPLALHTTLTTIPAEVPYLHVDIPAVPTDPRPRFGLVWSGSAGHKNDKNRSLPLASLAPLLTLPVDWVCLQPELRASDAAWLAANADITLERPALPDFAATARLIMGLDVVLTVDTAVAHLAGALGKPVWLMLAQQADYRWLLDRDDSPWYPTMRLFRQAAPGDWMSVIAAVEQAIHAHPKLH